MKIYLLLISIVVTKIIGAQDSITVDAASLDFYNLNFVQVEQEGKARYYNLQGNQLLDSIVYSGSGVFRVKKNGQWGALTSEGKWVVPTVYDELAVEMGYPKDMPRESGVIYPSFKVKKNGKASLLDVAGNQIQLPVYDDLKIISEKLIGFKEGVLWGWMSSSGNLLQKPAFTGVANFNFSPDHVEIRSNKKIGVALFNGQLVVPPVADDIKPAIASGKLTFIVKSNEKAGVVDSTGKEIIKPVYSSILFQKEPNLFFVRNEKKLFGLYDAEGKSVLQVKYNQIYDFERDRSQVFIGNKAGIVDQNGRTVIPAEFDGIEILSSDGLAGGWADTSMKDELRIGIRAVNPLPDQTLNDNFKKEAAAMPYFFSVENSAGKGLYNWKGKELIKPGTYNNLIPYYYNHATYFVAVKNDLKGLVDSNGTELVPVSYLYIEPSAFSEYENNVQEKHNPNRNRFLLLDLYHTKGIYDLQQRKMILPVKHSKIEWIGNSLLTGKYLEDCMLANYLYELSGQHRKLPQTVTQIRKVGPSLVEEENQTGFGEFSVNTTTGATIYKWVKQFSHSADLSRLPDRKSYIFQSGLKKIADGRDNLFINEKGEEVVFSKYTHVTAFDQGIAFTAVHQKSKRRDAERYLYGIIDSSGRELVAPQWEHFEPVGYHPHLIIVKADGKSGIINRAGKYLVPLQFDSIYLDQNSLIIVQKNGKTGIYNQEGVLKVPPIYEEILPVSIKESVFLVKATDGYYFIDCMGRKNPLRAKRYIKK